MQASERTALRSTTPTSVDGNGSLTAGVALRSAAWRRLLAVGLIVSTAGLVACGSSSDDEPPSQSSVYTIPMPGTAP